MNRLRTGPNAGPLFLSLALLAAGCTGIEPELRTLMRQTTAEDGELQHVGPPVEVADAGPAPYARVLHEAFRPARAMELVTFIDRFYRAPANDGYEEVLARLAKELRGIGFAGEDPRLEVEILEGESVEAWTPVSAQLVLEVDGEEPRTLHAFVKSEDVDRVMLPVHAPACDVEAQVSLRLDDLKKGMILVTNVPAAQVLARAESRGAAAVVSAYLYDFNQDQSGSMRHMEAIQFASLPPGSRMPVAQISPRSLEVIESAVERAQKRGAKVRLHFRAVVKTEKRPLRTLMAVVRGAKHPDEAVTMVSHVQEPGANDNASGVAGLFEGVRALVESLRAEAIPWPDRSLVFLWGDEFRQSETWLETTDMKPIAGISSDMTGQSHEGTGAIALLERNYDPGALKVLGPDFHTPWGAGQVDPSEIIPNGLAVIARCALADVSMLEGGSWHTAEHPWEGGSDHDVFIRRKVPAILFWHFTDFAYHTSLDRLQYVDPDEIRRTGVALLSTALAVASAGPQDLERYVQSLEKERLMRLRAADEANDPEIAAHWESWCKGAREWLRNLCLGIEDKIPGQPKK